jgi:hypothetical protein
MARRQSSLPSIPTEMCCYFERYYWKQDSDDNWTKDDLLHGERLGYGTGILQDLMKSACLRDLGVYTSNPSKDAVSCDGLSAGCGS